MDVLAFFVPAFVVVGLALILAAADKAPAAIRRAGRQIGGAFVILSGLLLFAGILALIGA